MVCRFFPSHDAYVNSALIADYMLPQTLPPPPHTASLRAALRSATHAAHVRLNQHALLAGLTRRGYPLDQYHSVLRAYFQFYRLVENAIGAAITQINPGFDYSERRKLGWLEADLAHFQINPLADPDHTPAALRNLRIDTPGKLIGVLYVIEGSTLGGQVIARHLAENLNLTATTGARFFTAYGALIEPRWQAFLDWAESVQAAGEVHPEACAQATTLFQLLEELLDVHAHPID
jgi:heme oxygenase